MRYAHYLPRACHIGPRSAGGERRSWRPLAPKLRVVLLGALLVSGWSLLLAPAPTAKAAGVLEPYLTNLDWPDAMAFASDGRLFYGERLTGVIRVVQDGTLLPTPFYQLANLVSVDEDGLLGLTLSPGFPSEPWVYVYYTYMDVPNASVFNRISRIRAAGNEGQSEEVLLDRIHHAIYHNGGPMAFGPDGKLYAVVGDALDIPAAQDLGSRSGKVLRINPDGTAPTDNPFSGNASADPYVFTYGHRSMFGLAFHPMTGRLFATENGPECNDEVNLIIPGRNYGWGPNETCSSPPDPPSNTNRDGPDPVLPLVWWTPPIAPTNAVVYGGPNFTELQGDLIIGDYNTGSLRRIDLEGPDYDTVVGQTVLVRVSEGILAVSQGPDGAIWFTTQSAIYRFVDQAQRPQASFTATPNPAHVGVPVAFDASASTDPDGMIVSYAWDFGDGAYAMGIQVTHVYVSKGIFAVTLIVTDESGASSSRTESIVLGNRPPFIIASSPAIGALTFEEGVPVTFSVNASDPDGDSLTYRWSVNGNVVGAASRSFEFGDAAPGTYLVNVTVSDGSSAVSQEWNVTVHAQGVPPASPASPASLDWRILVPFLAIAFSGIAVFVVWQRFRRKRRVG